MKYLRAYLDDLATLAAARAWVNHNGLPLVADCMYHLNRFAPDSYGLRSPIYTLKNRFIRQLYYLGHCQSAALQIQKLVCRACSGTGVDSWHDYEECWKCHGTGIYRIHTLYQFVFDIHGQRYSWHQPERLVDWPVALTTPIKGEYLDNKTSHITLDRDQARLYMAAVYAWLRTQRVPARELPALPSLRYAIRQELYNSTPYQRWLSYRNRLAIRLRRIKRALSNDVPNLEHTDHYDPDEIPF